MKLLNTIAAAAAVSVATASMALAGGGVTDQTYKAGKYSGSSSHVMNNCPREYREMYRGDLYCRQPEYQVTAPRSAHCPEHASVLYRGNLYCVSGRG